MKKKGIIIVALLMFITLIGLNTHAEEIEDICFEQSGCIYANNKNYS